MISLWFKQKSEYGFPKTQRMSYCSRSYYKSNKRVKWWNGVSKKKGREYDKCDVYGSLETREMS